MGLFGNKRIDWPKHVTARCTHCHKTSTLYAGAFEDWPAQGPEGVERWYGSEDLACPRCRRPLYVRAIKAPRKAIVCLSEHERPKKRPPKAPK